MSSSNKTTHSNLSQFVDTDRPTILGDYNTDMSKIDEELHTTNVNLTTAQNTANDAHTLAQTAQTGVNGNKTAITNLTSTVSANKTAQAGVNSATNAALNARHTKTEADTLLAAKADKSSTYTKTEANSKVGAAVAAEAAARDAAILVETNARKAADTKEVADRNSAIAAAVAGTRSKMTFDFVKDFGADPTGAASSDAAFDAMLAKCKSEGGIKVHVPIGKFKATKIWRWSSNTGDYLPPLSIEGSGSISMSTTAGEAYTVDRNVNQGSVFFSTVADAPDSGFFVFDAFGAVHIQDVAFANLTNTTTKDSIINILSSMVTMERVSIHGHSSYYKRSCIQQGIELGGGSNYKGYGSSFKDIVFDRIGTQFYLNRASNSIRFDNIVGSNTCGHKNASAVLMAADSAGLCVNNCFTNYILEGPAYDHAITMAGKVKSNTFINFAAWDCWGSGQMTSVCAVTGNGCIDNMFIMPWLDGQGAAAKLYQKFGGTTAANYYLDQSGYHTV